MDLQLLLFAHWLYDLSLLDKKNMLENMHAMIIIRGVFCHGMAPEKMMATASRSAV